MADTDTIPETSLKDLDPRLRKQVENAQKTMDKNPTYTVDVCMGILQRNPGCLDVRKLLRKAQRRAKNTKSKGLTKFIGSVTSAPFAIKAGNQIKKDPVAVLESAERMITANPANVTAYKTLGSAASSLGLWNTAIFAFQDIKLIEPANLDNRVALMEAFIEAGMPKDAIAEGEKILTENPAKEAAQNLLRKASVAESMDRGKWEEEDKDFRDKLADAEKSVELEQASRVANDEDTLDKLIETNLNRIEQDSENLNLYREVINAYKQLEQYDKAIAMVERARATSNGASDPTLERQHSDLKVAAMQVKITELEERDGENESDQLKGLKTELFDFRLAAAKDIVEKYPNDYAAKFELGLLLFQQENYDAAIQEFQLAQRNPNVRTKALLNLGRAYLAKDFSDMAVEQLVLAKKDIPMMNDLKKETIYDLAQAYEQMGDEELAIGEYKIIYQADIGYRDVADKINQFYANRRKS